MLLLFTVLVGAFCILNNLSIRDNPEAKTQRAETNQLEEASAPDGAYDLSFLFSISRAETSHPAWAGITEFSSLFPRITTFPRVPKAYACALRHAPKI